MADPHPHYVDLDDAESTEDDEASEEPSVPSDVEDSEQDEEEEEPDVQTNSNYAIYLSRMGPRDEPSEPESDFKPGNGGKRRKIGSQETAAFETGESSQTSQWNPNEIDGLFCPICLEAWTSDGDHYICCLPCGHIFGNSCIKKWIGQSQKQKCPQCNAKCKWKDVRKLFASRVIAVDEESQKRIRSLEGKCASLEKERAEWHKKEAELLKAQGVLERKIQQLMEMTLTAPAHFYGHRTLPKQPSISFLNRTPLNPTQNPSYQLGFTSPSPQSDLIFLCRDNLQFLRLRYYYATLKADGTRYMILITMDGCFLIDKSFNFRRVQMRFPCKHTIDVSAEKVHHFTLLYGEMVFDTVPDSQKQERRCSI